MLRLDFSRSGRPGTAAQPDEPYGAKEDLRTANATQQQSDCMAHFKLCAGYDSKAIFRID